MPHELPKLSYAYDALEPFIDAPTMEIHHTKHHQAYVTKLNAALEKHLELGALTLPDLLRQLPTLAIDPAEKKPLQNHGGGHLNHSLFWQWMNPSNVPDAGLQAELVKTFGSVATFKEQFSQTAVNLFGSGWAWLARDAAGKLQVYGLPNQDSPYLQGHTPVLGLDVWEHAYYLKYQSARADYVAAWWNVVKLI
ncbi:MAG: superoxide dismutase [Patescibacteria group bacterium]